LADYYKADAFEVAKATRNTILSMISAQPGITLANLLHHGEGVSTDDIYHLIADEEIYVNLTEFPLVEAERCLLFIDKLYEETYNAIILSKSTTNTIHSLGIELTPGVAVLYSGKSLTITLVGEAEVLLQTEEQQIVTFRSYALTN